MKKYSNFYQSPSSHIINNLHLLGITAELCYKQTKQTLEQPSILKLTYFIYHSLKCLTEDYQELKNWYPPRTVADQGQFKKIAMDLITRLQQTNKVPRNFVIDKRSFDDYDRCTGILRYLTEFALRQSYIQKYGDLVQISLSSNNENIDKYYPQILIQNCLIQDDLLQIFQTHLEILKSQLISKSTYQPFALPFNYQEIMNFIDYQNQIKDKLSKVPKQIFSENRELDRIQVIDKLTQIWRTLDIGVQQTDIGSNEFVEGEKQLIQIDVQWQGWLRKLVSGLRGLSKKKQQQQIKNPKKLENMKKVLSELKQDVEQLKQFKQDISSIMMD